MRGRKKRNEGMKLGRTIVAEREYAESEQDRMAARKKVRKKRTLSFLVMVMMVGVLGLLTYLGVQQLTDRVRGNEAEEETYIIRAEIVDETGRGDISTRMKEYISRLEQDFQDLGYTITRVTLPAGTSRELYVDLAGVDGYFKVNIDRDAAVSAEDAERMIRYLREREIKPEYVDVRIAGKAYYK